MNLPDWRIGDFFQIFIPDILLVTQLHYTKNLNHNLPYIIGFGRKSEDRTSNRRVVIIPALILFWISSYLEERNQT